MNLAQKFVIMIFGVLIVTSMFIVPCVFKYSSYNTNGEIVQSVSFYFILNPPFELVSKQEEIENKNIWKNLGNTIGGYKVPARDIQISIIGAEIVLMTMFFFLFKTNKKKIE